MPGENKIHSFKKNRKIIIADCLIVVFIVSIYFIQIKSLGIRTYAVGFILIWLFFKMLSYFICKIQFVKKSVNKHIKISLNVSSLVSLSWVFSFVNIYFLNSNNSAHGVLSLSGLLIMQYFLWTIIIRCVES